MGYLNSKKGLPQPGKSSYKGQEERQDQKGRRKGACLKGGNQSLQQSGRTETGKGVQKGRGRNGCKTVEKRKKGFQWDGPSITFRFQRAGPRSRSAPLGWGNQHKTSKGRGGQGEEETFQRETSRKSKILGLKAYPARMPRPAPQATHPKSFTRNVGDTIHILGTELSGNSRNENALSGANGGLRADGGVKRSGRRFSPGKRAGRER